LAYNIFISFIVYLYMFQS